MQESEESDGNPPKRIKFDSPPIRGKQIFFATRTHSQVAQIVRELRSKLLVLAPKLEEFVFTHAYSLTHHY